MISPHFTSPLDFTSSITRVAKELDQGEENSFIALAATLILGHFGFSKIMIIVETLFGHDAAQHMHRVINAQADLPQAPWCWMDQSAGTLELNAERYLDLLMPRRGDLEEHPPIADIIP